MGLRDVLLAAESREKKRGILVPLITEYLNNKDTDAIRYPFWVQDRRNRHTRHDLRFHPSQIDQEFCPRAWCFDQHELIPTRPESHDVKTLRTFEIGNMYHSMVQGWFAQMGRLYGLWECTKCGDTWWGRSNTEQYPTAPCLEGMQHSPIVYREVPIDHPETRILGHCDGEVITGGDDEPELKYALELKSCHSRVYENIIKQPLERHIFQAGLYLHVRSQKNGRQKGEPKREHPVQGAIILYINKETGDLREHLITMTDELMERKIQPVLDEMAEARAFDGKDLGTLPHRICASEEIGEIRKCAFTEQCFHSFPQATK